MRVVDKFPPLSSSSIPRVCYEIWAPETQCRMFSQHGYIYIIYTRNLEWGIAVPVREREQRHFGGSSERAGGSTEGARGRVRESTFRDVNAVVSESLGRRSKCLDSRPWKHALLIEADALQHRKYTTTLNRDCGADVKRALESVYANGRWISDDGCRTKQVSD